MGIYQGMMGAIRSKLALDYGYANARVHAMRTRLLSGRFTDDLLKLKTNAAVAEYLSRTAYKEDFAGMGTNIDDESRVEAAASKNFARNAAKLLRITPKQSRKALEAFLYRYDIHNLKTILLARKLGKSAQETQGLLVMAGSLGKGELSALMSAKSSDELYDAIRGTQIGARFMASGSVRNISRSQIKAAFSNPSEGRLELLMAALDSYYYEAAASSISPNEKDAKIIIDLLKFEADSKNSATIMRLKKSGADKKTIFSSMVQGGSLSRSQLEKMAGAKDVSESASLAGSYLLSDKTEFQQAQEAYKADGQLSHFEVALEKSMADKSLHTLRRSTMSIGSIVGFLLLKEEEVSNIRKIVRGKALGLPPERISGMLVLVE